jgi:hypothetical protein
MMRDRVEGGKEYGPVSSIERERERIREKEKEREQDREKERERERKWQQLQQQHSAAPQSAPVIPQASGPAPPPPAQLNRHIMVCYPFYLSFEIGTFVHRASAR